MGFPQTSAAKMKVQDCHECLYMLYYYYYFPSVELRGVPETCSSMTGHLSRSKNHKGIVGLEAIKWPTQGPEPLGLIGHPHLHSAFVGE